MQDTKVDPLSKQQLPSSAQWQSTE